MQDNPTDTTHQTSIWKYGPGKWSADCTCGARYRGAQGTTESDAVRWSNDHKDRHGVSEPHNPALCNVQWPWMRCVLPTGHDGMHRTAGGTEFTNSGKVGLGAIGTDFETPAEPTRMPKRATREDGGYHDTLQATKPTSTDDVPEWEGKNPGALVEAFRYMANKPEPEQPTCLACATEADPLRHTCGKTTGPIDSYSGKAIRNIVEYNREQETTTNPTRAGALVQHRADVIARDPKAMTDPDWLLKRFKKLGEAVYAYRREQGVK